MAKRAIKSAIAVVLVIALLMGGIGWYFSSKAAATNLPDTYDIKVNAVNGDNLTISQTDNDELPGTYAFYWGDNNCVIMDTVVSSDSNGVVRHVLRGKVPPVGTKLSMQTDLYKTSPTAAGLSYQDVEVSTPLGLMPAWFIDGTTNTWVITLHGHDNQNRLDGLNTASIFHKLGYPLLDITYRNDAGAPKSGDGKNHLGYDEWHDADSAIAYANAHGAKSIILDGASMGGGIALMTARHSVNKSEIKALVLDSPVIDWRNVLDSQGGSFHLPLIETRVAEKMYSWRTGFDFNDMDQLKHVNEFDIPILMFNGDKDTYVPTGPADKFTKALPGLVTQVKVHNAYHAAEFNVDPTGYESHIDTFLSALPQ